MGLAPGTSQGVPAAAPGAVRVAQVSSALSQQVAVEPTSRRSARASWGISAPARVWTGSRFLTRIRVSPAVAPQARPVKLQVRRSGAWRTVASKRLTSRTSWRPVVSAGSQAARLRLRLLAPRHRDRPMWRSSVRSVQVAKAPVQPGVVPGRKDPVTTPPAWDPTEALAAGTPLGAASDWSWMDAVNRPTWPDCQVIRWAYNPAGSYGSALPDVRRSFARIAGVSGLRFRYVGESGALTTADYDIGVSWSQADGFEQGVIGVTYFRYTVGGGQPSRIKSGSIVFNNDLDLVIGMDAPPGEISTGQLFQHEIMHAVGLGHAETDTQLMYPYASTTNSRLGAGDLAGLRAVGASC